MSDPSLPEPEPGAMERPIIVYGHETLRLMARPVANIDEDTLKLVASLQATIRSAQGIGLAAPQVGISQR
ncbi:MAG: peptide deformylase, partial [Candidatus Eisenbacteria sp.]|nr:peptide deformylase [Candidatus Eisenbacteria bacterium]